MTTIDPTSAPPMGAEEQRRALRRVIEGSNYVPDADEIVRTVGEKFAADLERILGAEEPEGGLTYDQQLEMMAHLNVWKARAETAEAILAARNPPPTAAGGEAAPPGGDDENQIADKVVRHVREWERLNGKPVPDRALFEIVRDFSVTSAPCPPADAARPGREEVGALWDALKCQCCATPPTDPKWEDVTTCVQLRRADLAKALSHIPAPEPAVEALRKAAGAVVAAFRTWRALEPRKAVSMADQWLLDLEAALAALPGAGG